MSPPRGPAPSGGTGASLREVLDLAAARLAAAQVPSPRADAALLLAHVLEVDTGEVHRRILLGGVLAEALAPRLAALVDRRCAREPLQHLTGRAPFRRLDLAVGPGAFVPRPETETLVQLVVDHLRARRDEDAQDGTVGDPLVVDLCTGTGAIALAVADEVAGVRVHGVERSPDALLWAHRNVEETGLPVELHEGDAADPGLGGLPALAALAGAVDVVASNPPYIPPEAVPVDPEVARHDPHLALYGGGADGLDVPRGVLEVASVLLTDGGLVVMEHADVQSATLTALLAADPRWRDVRAHEDLTGRPRAVSARRAARGGGRLIDSSA